MGGALGIVLAIWGVDLLVGLAPKTLPGIDQAGVDWRVLVAAFAVTFISGAVISLIPAWTGSRIDLTRALKGSGINLTTGTRDQRAIGLFVIFQIALALVLVVGSGLLLRSYGRIMQVELGFATDHLLALRVTGNRLTPVHDSLLERLNALPGIISAGSMTSLPLTGEPSDVYLMSRLPADGSSPAPPPANLRTVSLNSFNTLGIGLKQGRIFTASDTAHSPRVFVINEALERRLWPNQNAVGQRMSLKFKMVIGGSGDMQYAEGEVVGVVRDIKYGGPEAEPPLEAYLPFSQRFRDHYLTSIAVRCSTDPNAMAETVRKEILNADVSLRVASIATMEGLYADATANRRFLLTLISVFATVAYGLAVIGTYGVVACAVSARLREAGIRIAFGATRVDIAKLVIKKTTQLVTAGLAVGLTVALGLRRAISSQLFGISSLDPIAVGAGVFTCAILLLAACWLPAHRATRVNPIEALRAE